MRRELALLPPPDPQRDQGTPEERAQEEKRRQLVELLAEIEKRINEENARPKKRYISPATREEVYALYYDQLRRKIEERGTRNFPEYQGKKLYGELTMNVTVDAEGRVIETEVVRPSNSKMLDRRAVAIVKAAAPFGPFTRGDAAQGRPARDHLALPVHARGRARDHAQRAAMSLPRHGPLRRGRQPGRAQPVARSSTPRSRGRPARRSTTAGCCARSTASPTTLRALRRRPRRGPVRGCNVTVPFKFEAFALAPRAHRRAALAQAANMLRFDADGWLADNTDGVGLVRDIERNAGVPLAGRRVLLIGAGGAAAGALGPLLAARAGRAGGRQPHARQGAGAGRAAPRRRRRRRALPRAPPADCGARLRRGRSTPPRPACRARDVPVAPRCWRPARWRST